MKSTVVRSALMAASIFALGALAPAAASAKSLKPGLWDVGGIQQICLVADGTWYGTTFPTWNGHWNAGAGVEDQNLVYGNYTFSDIPGVGNDSMVIDKQNLADWTEWNDYTVQVGFDDDVQWTFIQKSCPPPASQNRSGHKNPLD